MPWELGAPAVRAASSKPVLFPQQHLRKWMEVVVITHKGGQRSEGNVSDLLVSEQGPRPRRWARVHAGAGQISSCHCSPCELLKPTCWHCILLSVSELLNIPFHV